MGPASGKPSGTWNFEVASSFMEDLWALVLGYISQNQGIVVSFSEGRVSFSFL